MKIYHLFRRGVILCIIAISLLWVSSCEEEPFDPSKGPSGKDRYATPDWLGETSVKMLEDSANYSIYIQLMDKAGLRDQLESQLFTLFVPDNDAFNAYFQKHGYSSLDDLTEEEAETLFKLHFVTNGRSAFQLKYEYRWQELQGPQGEYASLFYRKDTGARSIPYKEKVRYNVDYMDRGDNGELLMYTGFKMIPLMSRDFFEDFFGDPEGSDYLLMYPGSKWANNLNWHNAAVTNAEVPTGSGFIYFIDQVVDNMENIDEYLMKNQDKFGVYYDLMQRFANYTSPKKFESYGEQLLYMKSYDLIFNVANELGPEPGDPTQFKACFSALVPVDDAMQKYLDETVLKTYPSIDSIPEITLFYIVQSQLSRQLVLMSKVENLYFNAFGDETKIKREDVLGGQMCSNGPVYAMNSVLEPNVFKTVPRQLFFNADYSTFLFALDEAEMITQVSDVNKDITLFAITNAEMEAANLRYNDLDDRMETRGEEGIWDAVEAEALVEFLGDHIYEGVLDDLSGEGYIEMLSRNFVHYKDGKLEAGKNMAENMPASIENKEVNDYNGILYNISKAIQTNYTYGQYLLDNPELSEFAALMDSVGFLMPDFIDPYTMDTIPQVNFIAEAEYWTAFIPDNDAMASAASAGLIPTDLDSLKNFLSYHFIRKSTIFDDGKLSGDFTTNTIESTVGAISYYKVNIDNSVNRLVVTDGSGKKVTVAHADANTLVNGGVAHKISSVLTN